MMDWLLLDQTQADAAKGISVSGYVVDPVLIDNPQADNQGLGALTGKYALPLSVLTDTRYADWHPLLSQCQVITLDDTLLFVQS